MAQGGIWQLISGYRAYCRSELGVNCRSEPRWNFCGDAFSNIRLAVLLQPIPCAGTPKGSADSGELREWHLHVGYQDQRSGKMRWILQSARSKISADLFDVHRTRSTSYSRWRWPPSTPKRQLECGSTMQPACTPASSARHSRLKPQGQREVWAALPLLAERQTTTPSVVQLYPH